MERIIRWTGKGRRLTMAEVAAERQRLESSFPDDDPAMHARLLDPQIREEWAVVERFPAYSSVVLGRDGRIWIRASRMRGSEGTDEWLIFALTVRSSVAYRRTASEQMPDFGSDNILVMRRDELGVERIFQHTLRGPVAAE